MSCTAVILAAGSDTMNGSDIPNPFVIVEDKPVLVYTLEVFQRHPQIDGIQLACLKGWEQVAFAYAKQYNISKLRGVTEGGKTIQETIRNGLESLADELQADDLVVIHDGVRPLLEESVLTDTIMVAAEKGNAISSMPNNEQVFVADENDPSVTRQFVPREKIRRVTTPQAYRFGELLDAYRYAFGHHIGIDGPSYANTLFADLGKTLYFSAGSDKNIKLNTEENVSIFEACLKSGGNPGLK